MTIELNADLHGKILDVGGGGEGIIGRIYGHQVTAIDNCKEELDEVPDVCEKRIMDAANLQFPEASFDHVTFFYSLMYMSTQTQEKALSEACRVLKPEGKLWIWDAEIESAYPEPFVADLDIRCGTLAIHTAYGIVKENKQSAALLADMAGRCGLICLSSAVSRGQIFQCWRKKA